MGTLYLIMKTIFSVGSFFKYPSRGQVDILVAHHGR